MPTWYNKLIDDVASLIGTGKTVAELQDESRGLDSRLLALQQQRAEDNPEKFDTEEYREQFAEHFERQQEETEDIDESIDEARHEGYEEGLQNIKDTVAGPLGVVGDTIKSILAGIPWWVFVGAGVALFVYLGGGSIVRSFIGRKVK